LIGISGLAGSGKDTCADLLVRNYDFNFTKVSFADPMKRIARDVYGFSFDQMWGPSEARNAPDERYPREHGPFRSDRCACCGVDFGGEAWRSLPSFQEESRKRPCFLTPRFALQQLGSEWGRVCYPNTWVDYALNVAKKLNVEGGYNYTQIHGLEHVWRPGDENWQTSVVIPDVRFKNELEAIRAHGGKLIRIVRQNAGLKGGAGQHRSETEQTSMQDELFDGIILNNKGLDWLGKAVDDLVADWIDK